MRAVACVLNPCLRTSGGVTNTFAEGRHCERAKQSNPLPARLDCFVASLLAMTFLTVIRHPRDLVLV